MFVFVSFLLIVLLSLSLTLYDRLQAPSPCLFDQISLIGCSFIGCSFICIASPDRDTLPEKRLILNGPCLQVFLRINNPDLPLLAALILRSFFEVGSVCLSSTRLIVSIAPCSTARGSWTWAVGQDSKKEASGRAKSTRNKTYHCMSSILGLQSPGRFVSRKLWPLSLYIYISIDTCVLVKSLTNALSRNNRCFCKVFFGGGGGGGVARSTSPILGKSRLFSSVISFLQ